MTYKGDAIGLKPGARFSHIYAMDDDQIRDHRAAIAKRRKKDALRSMDPMKMASIGSMIDLEDVFCQVTLAIRANETERESINPCRICGKDMPADANECRKCEQRMLIAYGRLKLSCPQDAYQSGDKTAWKMFSHRDDFQRALDWAKVAPSADFEEFERDGYTFLREPSRMEAGRDCYLVMNDGNAIGRQMAALISKWRAYNAHGVIWMDYTDILNDLSQGVRIDKQKGDSLLSGSFIVMENIRITDCRPFAWRSFLNHWRQFRKRGGRFLGLYYGSHREGSGIDAWSMRFQGADQGLVSNRLTIVL